MMVNSLAGSRAPSRQASGSLRSQPATPEALTPNHASSRDASATDLVRLTSQFDAGEVSRHLRGAENSESSSVAEWQERMQVSSFEAARYRQTASAAGQAAGALNAEVSVPELASGNGAQRTADVSGRPSDVGSGAAGDLRAGSARSTTSERTSTWLSRVTAKSDDLRSVFGLPETEVRHPCQVHNAHGILRIRWSRCWQAVNLVLGLSHPPLERLPEAGCGRLSGSACSRLELLIVGRTALLMCYRDDLLGPVLCISHRSKSRRHGQEAAECG
jgi:hypothetical protein